MIKPKSAHLIVETPHDLGGKFEQFRHLTISTPDLRAWLRLCDKKKHKHVVLWKSYTYGHLECDYVVVTFDTFLDYLDGCSALDDYIRNDIMCSLMDHRLCHKNDITFVHSEKDIDSDFDFDY